MLFLGDEVRGAALSSTVRGQIGQIGDSDLPAKADGSRNATHEEGSLCEKGPVSYVELFTNANSLLA